MSYSETTQRAKVAATYKGDTINYKGPMLHPPMTFVDAVPAEVKAKMGHTGIVAQNISDPWYSRKR